MKKNDWILGGAVLAAALAFFLINGFAVRREGAHVRVTVDGELFGTYLLTGEQEIDINGTNHLSIRNGQADMTEANCPDHRCVRQKAIDKNGETIVCLPNRVVVEVTGGDPAEADAVAN